MLIKKIIKMTTMKLQANIKQCILAGIIAFCSLNSVAQTDPHFSQYYANPIWLNPALTGVVDGNYRASVNLKQQWSSLSNSYLTGGASFDVAPTKNLAYGITIMNQQAGELDFNYLTALASASYRVRFGVQGLNILNFGLQAGIINRSFDMSKGRFGDQFDPGSGYNGSLPSGENLASSSSLVPDINAGFMYFDANPDKSANLFFGASASHLTRPTEKFSGNSERTNIRYTGHGGVRIKTSPILDIIPNALYMSQGNAREISAGAYAQLMVNNTSNILFGGNYRVDDAAIAFVGLQLNNMVFGLSYDVNTSSLNTATRHNGGFELSVSLLGRNGIIGPNFFCPRL
jgi:type IX secretion system PorP/SprF family membrane protein